jgi:histidyl-tRNA synthetase
MIDPKLAFSTIKAKHDLAATARMAHWNVRGTDYYEAHTLFERIYEDAAANTDELVEILRALGYTPSFEEFSGPGGTLPSFSRAPLIDLLIERTTDYYTKLGSLRDSLKDDASAVGLVNLLEDLAQVATVILYLLSASKGL